MDHPNTTNNTVITTKRPKQQSKKSSSLIMQFIIFIGILSYCITSIILFNQLENDTHISPDINIYLTKDMINIHTNNINKVNHDDSINNHKNNNDTKEKSNDNPMNNILNNGNDDNKDNKDNQDKHKEPKSNPPPSSIDNHNDKQKVISILQQSGLTITQSIIDSLPTWSEIQSLYGPKPIIYGLETCSTFQQNIVIPTQDAYIGGSGMFNTGTNLLADLLLKYCTLEEKRVDVGGDSEKKKKKREFGEVRRMESGMVCYMCVCVFVFLYSYL